MSKITAELKRLLLLKPRLTLGVAESLTCGRVQSLIGEISGASEFFIGGITAYTLEQKVRHLGVDRRVARKVDAVSAAVAEQMARGACALFDSDLGLATTGYAEPAPAKRITTPFAWWAIAHRAHRGRGFAAVWSGRVECPGANRSDAQAIVAAAVVTELVAYVRGWRRGGNK